MRFEHGFKLLTCVVLFSAGMFAGGSEAETITFSEFSLKHGSEKNAYGPYQHVNNFDLTIASDNFHAPGRPEEITSDGKRVIYDGTIFRGYASAGPMDSMIADQPALLQPDRPAIKSANPEAVDSGGFNPVPEPASMLLVGSGLIVLAGVGRRKFFKKKSRNGKASYSQLTAHTDQ
jgi:hypothetical protein